MDINNPMGLQLTENKPTDCTSATLRRMHSQHADFFVAFMTETIAT